MKTLYLRIYLTVVAILLFFAIVAGLVAQMRLEHEHATMQAQSAERAIAWATLLGNSLPEATTAPNIQRDALLDWSLRLHIPLALDDAQGGRIATSPLMPGSDHPELLNEADGRLIRLTLTDGRTLWLWRSWRSQHPPPPPGPGPLFLPPWLMGGGILATLLILFVAIAAGAWPVVRRLTLRLERLKYGVDKFGAGQLSTRIQIDGQDEVAAVAQSFNAAAARIEELVRANSSLLANASHELRSPLARLKMALSLFPSADSARQAELSKEAELNIKELDELVEEVLMASRLDAKTGYEFEAVDALSLAAEESSRVDAHIKLEPSADGPWIVMANERLLRRALRNLLENAKRYGVPAQAAAQTDADLPAIELILKREGPTLSFEVCDRGPGVPSSEVERIFEPFYRLSGHAEHAGGVGLGLSLVRQIAQRHRGTVNCLAREGGGSRFVLTLPVTQPKVAA